MCKPLLVVLASSLIFQVPVSAQAPAQPQTQADLATGIRQVEEGDLEAAVITLDTVIQRLKPAKGQERDLATAHLYLSMAHLGLSQWERAKAEMREAWHNNRELVLDPQKFPPRVIQLYEQTKNEQKQAVASPPSTPAPPAQTAQAAPSKKGGSKKVAVLLGLGVAAAGGIALAAGGNGDTGSLTCTPTVTIASVLPSGSAIAGVTVVSFTASSSAQAGCTSALRWSFNDDGTSTTGTTVTHIFNTAGTFSVVVTATTSQGSTTASSTVVVRSLTGRWLGFATVGDWEDAYLDFTQTGASLTGRAQFGGAASGTLSNPRNVSFQFIDKGSHAVNCSGSLDDALNAMALSCNHQSSTVQTTLRRQ